MVAVFQWRMQDLASHFQLWVLREFGDCRWNNSFQWHSFFFLFGKIPIPTDNSSWYRDRRPTRTKEDQDDHLSFIMLRTRIIMVWSISRHEDLIARLYNLCFFSHRSGKKPKLKAWRVSLPCTFTLEIIIINYSNAVQHPTAFSSLLSLA